MPTWFIAFCKASDFIVYWGMLIPFVIAQQRHQWLSGGLKTLRYVPLFLWLMYVLMLLAAKLWQYNLPLAHLNTVGEALLYLKVYHDDFEEPKIKKRIRITAVAFLVFALLDSFWLEGFDKINSYTNLAESAILISICLVYFEKYISASYTSKEQATPLFIASIGIIIYLSGTIALYLTTNHFIALNDEYSTRLLFLLNAGLLFILSALFAKAFILIKPIHSVRSTQ